MSRFDTATSGIAIVQLVFLMASPHLDLPNGPFIEHPDSQQWPSSENTLVAYRRWDPQRYYNMSLPRLGVSRELPLQPTVSGWTAVNPCQDCNLRECIQRRRPMIPHNAAMAPDTLEKGQRMRSFLHYEIARSCEAAILAFPLYLQR